MKNRSLMAMMAAGVLLLGGCSADTGAAADTAAASAGNETAEAAAANTDTAQTAGAEEATVTAGTEAAGNTDPEEKTELIVLAAASLTDVCGELETAYEQKEPGIDLIFSYAGSGALQTQIEEGAPADLFISAARKQMNALKDEELLLTDTVCDLLENKVVLIVPGNSTLGLGAFEDAADERVAMIGLGDTESVPAGQYAQTIFTSLGCWDAVSAKANFGTDVRTVLSWVETGEVDCGVVYATDAYTSDQVKIVAEAPEGSCDPVIYPAAVVASSAHPEDAAAFLSFLKGNEAMSVFESYGFRSAE